MLANIFIIMYQNYINSGTPHIYTVSTLDLNSKMEKYMHKSYLQSKVQTD